MNRVSCWLIGGFIGIGIVAHIPTVDKEALTYGVFGWIIYGFYMLFMECIGRRSK